MKELLSRSKELAKTYANNIRGVSLKSIKTFKMGITGNTLTYPVLDIMPRYEVYRGYQNGGRYRVDRFIDFEVYTKTPKVTDSSKQLREVAAAVLNMFYDVTYPDNYKLTDAGVDLCFHFEPGEVDYQTNEEGDSLIQRAIIPMSFSSYETAPTFTSRSLIYDTSLQRMSEYVYDLLRGDVSLTKPKFFYSHGFPPITVGDGAVICVLDNRDERTRRESGRDNPTGYIDIIVWTKASPYEGSLTFNLDTVELIKDVLQKDQNMGGKAYMSRIERIEYGINQASFLYGSRISFQTFSYRTMPSY